MIGKMSTLIHVYLQNTLKACHRIIVINLNKKDWHKLFNKTCIVSKVWDFYCFNVVGSVLFQCRERGSSYLGSLSISMLWKVNGRIQGTVERKIADVPIMVKVRLCHVMYIVHKQKHYSLYIYLVHYSLLYMHTRYKFEVFGDTTLCFHKIDFSILDF